MPAELEREQAELQQLRAHGDAAAQREADQLQKLYHDRQMDGLAKDVYGVAAGDTGEPPAGWTRLSEHPDLVAQYAERLHTTPRLLMEALHPNNSGFRAEIYLPDAALQRAGYQPTLAFKGSSGEVKTSDGQTHDTTAEDFGANNFPQSVGLETDYYDRAMTLGNQLKRNGVHFESTGHSLAGGMAAAVAAVTGTHATTFNAAGLNPVTTERFARQHPGVAVSHDLNRLITNYQVQGELLSDGVQNNIHNMDALRRMELGATLKETCDILQRVPEASALLKQKLSEGMEAKYASYAPATVGAFVDKVATGNVDQMLRDLPLAAGEQHVLAAMTRDSHGNLVPRVQVTSLPETTRLAAPVLESLAMVSAGTRFGERGGEVMAAGGHLEARVLHAAGRGLDGGADALGSGAHAVTQAEAAVAQAGEHAIGATLAHARIAQAELTAQVDQGLGQVRQWSADFDAALLRGSGHLLPEHAQHAARVAATRLEQAGVEAHRQGAMAAAADRQAGGIDAAAIHSVTHALETATGREAEAYGAAQRAVIDGAGHHAHAGLDAAAHGIEGSTRAAPAVFGMAGAVAGLGTAGAVELTPGNFPRLFEAAQAGRAIAGGNADEAFKRHLMETMTPSLDAHIAAKEKQALQMLMRDAPTRTHEPGMPGATPQQPRPGHAAAGEAPLAAPAGPNPARNDPRHPDNANHALYQELRERIPDAGEKRLLQFTAACHAGGLGHRNLGPIAYDEHRGIMYFMPAAEPRPPVAVDVKTPSPEPQQSIQRIQQADRLHAHIHALAQAHGMQIGQQQVPGP